MATVVRQVLADRLDMDSLFDEHVLKYLEGTLDMLEKRAEVHRAFRGLIEEYVDSQAALEICNQIAQQQFPDEKEGAASQQPQEEGFVPLTHSVSLQTSLVKEADQASTEQAPEKMKQKKAKKAKVVKQLPKGTKLEFMVFRRGDGDAAPFQDIHLEHVDLQMSKGQKLLDDASVSLLKGHRYALVGRNGAGKTTLLRAIGCGEVRMPACSIIHVEQEAHGGDMTALQTVLAADVERAELMQAAAVLSEKEDDASGDKLLEVYDRMAEIDVDAAESNVCRMLSGLGFTERMYNSPTSSLSGGWRMRVSLARALFAKPDLLLIDEPTNFLDFKAKLWLERTLAAWPQEKTIVCVSHDRTFLNSGFITDVIHLHNQELTSYRGDYDSFEEQRNIKLSNLAKAKASQDAFKAHVQQFIDRFRFNAKRASLVQSRIKMLAKMEQLPAVQEDPTFQFNFPSGTGARDPLISFRDVEFGYSKDKILFSNVNFDIVESSRICLTGDNGQGKSTIIKLMLQKVQPLEGDVYVDGRLRIGYFAQHHVDSMDLNSSPLEYVQQNCPGMDEADYRGILGRYGITGGMADQQIITLSGGQKSRVAFALIGALKPQLLVMDEVEQHLDIESVDALAVALNNFDGGIILVSHDERLLQLVCNELWIVKDGGVMEWKKSFEEYKKYVQMELAKQ